MATDLTPAQLRKAARDFALKALQEMKTHRMYAMTPQAEIVLASLARAMFLRREIEGRKDGDGKSPSAHKEFFGLVEALSKAGCNILQARPTNPKPLPQVWRNPLNNEPLPPPKGVGERSLLQKLDPELLQMFDALEKEPYQTVAKMRQAEAQREAMSAIEYNESTHLANPFCRNDESAKAELFKRDPALAQFCQQEAKDVELNLFGQQRALTVRGKLFKDPEAATIVELAEKIHQLWRQEDKAAAADARAAAEAKLAELSASETPQPPRMVGRARIGVE
jgi:hypothetical protein